MFEVCNLKIESVTFREDGVTIVLIPGLSAIEIEGTIKLNLSHDEFQTMEKDKPMRPGVSFSVNLD